MIRSVLRVAFVLAASFAITAQGAAPAFAQAPLPLPPVPVTAYPGIPVGMEPRIIVYDSPAQVACREGAATPVAPADFAPAPTTVTVRQPVLPEGAIAAYPLVPIEAPHFAYSFGVSSDGRVVDLKADPATPGVVTGRQPYVFNGVLLPALARWRFPAGRAFTGCAATIQSRLLTLREADRALLARTLALNTGLTAQSAVYRALQGGGDCYDKPLHQRVIHYVATDEMARSPTRRDWVVERYDIAADGGIENVQMVGSSGRVELERATTAALQQSRYGPGARKGCLWRTFVPEEVLAYPRPAPVSNPSTGGCPANPKLELAAKPTYPPAYAAARVEGYALLSFDVAPWGQVGEVKVLDSQPTADFGQVALYAIRSAKGPKTERGYRGCLEPVIFRAPEDGPTTVTVTDGP